MTQPSACFVYLPHRKRRPFDSISTSTMLPPLPALSRLSEQRIIWSVLLFPPLSVCLSRAKTFHDSHYDCAVFSSPSFYLLLSLIPIAYHPWSRQTSPSGRHGRLCCLQPIQSVGILLFLGRHPTRVHGPSVEGQTCLILIGSIKSVLIVSRPRGGGNYLKKKSISCFLLPDCLFACLSLSK